MALVENGACGLPANGRKRCWTIRPCSTVCIQNWERIENNSASALSLRAKIWPLELRTKESLNAAAAFSVVIFCYSVSYSIRAEETKAFGSGLLWLVFAFAGALVFNRGFARELPNECLDTLLASPLSAGV